MKTRFRLAALMMIALFAPLYAGASVKITEIMYDLSGTDTDREWVEVYNDGSDPVTIVTGSSKGSWRFVDSSSHTLTPYVEGETQIPAGEYAIIAKDGAVFMNDWPGFNGTIFTSPFSLPNTSATIYIKDGDGNILDTATYSSSQGANGDGNSLQKNSSGNWIAATPTPGEANSDTGTSGGEVLGVSTGPGTSSSTSTLIGSSQTKTSTAPTSLDVQAGTDRVTAPGSPITFQATIKKNTVQNSGLTFSWSFGDGYIGEGQTFTHTYEYQGDYIVVLTARAGSIYSVSRIKVRVLDPVLSINANDKYIEIKNNSSSEINLFNWKLVRHNKGFVFQPDTIILPKSSIKFPTSLLSMKGEKEGNTVLKNNLGTVVADFEDPISEQEKINLNLKLNEAHQVVSEMRQEVSRRNVSQTASVVVVNKDVKKSEEVEQIENAVDPAEEIKGEKFEVEVHKNKLSALFEYIKNIFR